MGYILRPCRNAYKVSKRPVKTCRWSCTHKICTIREEWKHGHMARTRFSQKTWGQNVWNKVFKILGHLSNPECLAVQDSLTLLTHRKRLLFPNGSLIILVQGSFFTLALYKVSQRGESCCNMSVAQQLITNK